MRIFIQLIALPMLEIEIDSLDGKFAHVHSSELAPEISTEKHVNSRLCHTFLARMTSI